MQDPEYQRVRWFLQSPRHGVSSIMMRFAQPQPGKWSGPGAIFDIQRVVSDAERAAVPLDLEEVGAFMPNEATDLRPHCIVAAIGAQPGATAASVAYAVYHNGFPLLNEQDMARRVVTTVASIPESQGHQQSKKSFGLLSYDFSCAHLDDRSQYVDGMLLMVATLCNMRLFDDPFVYGSTLTNMLVTNTTGGVLRRTQQHAIDVATREMRVLDYLDANNPTATTLAATIKEASKNELMILITALESNADIPNTYANHGQLRYVLQYCRDHASLCKDAAAKIIVNAFGTLALGVIPLLCELVYVFGPVQLLKLAWLLHHPPCALTFVPVFQGIVCWPPLQAYLVTATILAREAHAFEDYFESARARTIQFLFLEDVWVYRQLEDMHVTLTLEEKVLVLFLTHGHSLLGLTTTNPKMCRAYDSFCATATAAQAEKTAALCAENSAGFIPFIAVHYGHIIWTPGTIDLLIPVATILHVDVEKNSTLASSSLIIRPAEAADVRVFCACPIKRAEAIANYTMFLRALDVIDDETCVSVQEFASHVSPEMWCMYGCNAQVCEQQLNEMHDQMIFEMIEIL